jgi:hypothetical protein
MMLSINLHPVQFNYLTTLSHNYSEALNAYVKNDGPHPDKLLTHLVEDGEITLLSIYDADGNRISYHRAESEEGTDL